MAKITPESIADLKALFQDNEKALGANFSQLIDFFNNNKVTDNGDGTFTVGNTIINVNDIVQGADVQSIIRSQLIYSPDLVNKDQLATKADTSAIDPSVMVKRTLTADDDVLALGPGTYYTWGVKPKNFPALVSWSTVVVKTVGNQPIDGKNVTITDTNASQLVNTYSGNASTGKWSGWRVPNSTTMASKTDLTTAISTATANMVDSSKLTNFTAGLQSGGVNVATAADLKSIEDQAWHTIALPDQQASKNLSLLYQVDKVNKQLKINLRGTFISATSDWKSGLVIADFGSIITSITSADIYVTFIKRFTDDTNANFTGWNYSGTTSAGVATTIEFNGSKVLIRCSDASVNNGYGKLSVPGGEDFAMVNNTINYANLV